MNRLSRALALAAAILIAIGAWSHGTALLYCLIAALVLFAAAWIAATRGGQTARPQSPLDATYYAQPLWRRVIAGLLGVRARPVDSDEEN